MNITAQFIITDEALFSNGDQNQQSEIKQAVLRRLRNRSATFDKLVEYDTTGDDNQEQLYDIDASDNRIITLVDVTITVDDQTLTQLENDPDLVFLKVISELEKEKSLIAGEWQQENVSHISFKTRA